MSGTKISASEARGRRLLPVSPDRPSRRELGRLRLAPGESAGLSVPATDEVGRRRPAVQVASVPADPVPSPRARAMYLTISTIKAIGVVFGDFGP
jgi:hypothetical protein